MKQVLINFRLIGEEADALKAIAAQQLRHPRDYVRWILRQELIKQGLVLRTSILQKGESENEKT
ncbi:MAG: hypothetical protein AAF629_30490 [Chloroflexota bacterium]